jgi:hypothetical protein
VFVSPRYSEDDARVAIAESSNWSEALRRLGVCDSGGNHAVLRRWAQEVWHIRADHFDPDRARHRGLRRRAIPLEDVLVRDSDYSRRMVKRRLYASGLKERRREMCGQGEIWRGRPIALILDHINGERRDNRLENLRIVCPNCAATLETHCGRKNLAPPEPRPCELCERFFVPRRAEQRFCSRFCGQRWPHTYTRPGARRVERPSYEQLRAEVEALGWSAVGRRYGVSDNAVRKWIRCYERELGASAGVVSPVRAPSSRRGGGGLPPVRASRQGS